VKSNVIKFDLYAWKGLDRHDVLVKGLLPAESVEAAEAQLSTQGISIVSLKVRPKWLTVGKFKKIRAADVVVFARQMSTMVTAGIPLVQAFEIVANGLDNLSMRAVVLTIHKDVLSGCTFADALLKHPKQFSYLVCSLVKTGEESGTLDILLDQIANYLERIELLKGRIKKAMLYPTVILVVTLGIAGLLLTFIVPQFQDLFASFEAELPMPTQIVIKLSNILVGNWALIFLGIAGSVTTYILLKRKSPGFQHFLDKLALKMFIFGPLVRKSVIARVSRTLSITLSAGIPLVDALECVAEVADNYVYRTAILQIRDDVVSGKQLYTSMEMTRLFPSMLLQMVSVGEKAGELEQMLKKIADYLDEQVNTAVDGLSTLIEPVMLIVLGLVVGGFVISMYLPIFRLGTVI